MEKEYVVEVKISGRAIVFTRAESESEAVSNVDTGNFYGGDIIEWSAEETVSAEEND